MALTVEDGTGKANADSYVSVADADAYVAAYGADATWTAATTAAKEEALRMGTQYLDLRFGVRWLGTRAHETQALAWPRLNVVDGDGYYVLSTVVPTRVKNAAAEAAVRHLTDTDGLMPDEDASREVTSESVTVGPISESKDYAGTKPTQARYTKVEALVSPYLRSITSLERG